jgi:DNA-binding NarL/FixJ family response regulator
MIRSGGAALSPDMARRLVQHFKVDESVNTQYQLSEKESQILVMLAEGWSYKKIAAALFLSVDGVRYYIKAIYSKLHVNSRGQAVSLYLAQKRVS